MADSHLKTVLLSGLVLVTAAGLFAQPAIKVTTKSGSSTVTTVTTPAPKVPAQNRTWEGLNSTDYFRFAPPNQLAPPNPEIAVGPEDILTVVERAIVWYPNPNSPLVDITKEPLSLMPNIPFGKLQMVLLDVWLGDLLTTADTGLCPTMPRTSASCVVSNATVRYDQLQGRFVVAATVVDTGFVDGAAYPAAARKASWVLVVSRFANLTTGAAGTTVPFTKPNPPDSIAGGVNSGNWRVYTGDINDVSQTGFTVPEVAAGVPTAAISCSVAAYGSTVDQATSQQVCYMPTNLRIGIDNNNIILASAVINDNIAKANRTTANPAYAGSRVRVFKKTKIYPWEEKSGNISLTKGSIFTPTAGDYYDVYPATQSPLSRYVWSVDPGTLGLFYEPIHLRGRAIATYSGTLVKTCTAPFDITPTKCEDSIDYLVGAVSSRAAGAPQTDLKWRRLLFDPATGVPALSDQASTTSVPAFSDPGCVAQAAYSAGPTKGQAAPFASSPCLFVGDDRPQRVMFREGFLYVARVGDRSVNSQLGNVTGAGLTSTVIYDVLQKTDPTLTVTPNAIIQAQWENGRYWAPMYDTPANVLQSGSINPINLLPFLEKLFVSTTYKATFPFDQPGSTDAFAGLYDMKDGIDAYDTSQTMVDPFTGAVIACNPAVLPVVLANGQQATAAAPTVPVTACSSSPAQALVPFGIRGSAATDPNDGSLWNYGAYARGREASVPGPGQWGTYVANYKLSFQATDPYGNNTAYFKDVQPGHQFFLFVQIARQLGLATADANGNFGPDALVLRKEMAKWVVLSQMDENMIDAYLKATGGADKASFADVVGPGSLQNGKLACGNSDKTKDSADCPFFRYIEVMSRRGYTKGCGFTNDGRRKYCPDDPLTRGQMAVFLIRAKENNVFPTILSGCPQQGGSICGPAGDSFGNFTTLKQIFSDVPTTHDFATYINKMNELGITRGYTDGRYGIDDSITRGQIAVFIVRAFFL